MRNINWDDESDEWWYEGLPCRNHQINIQFRNPLNCSGIIEYGGFCCPCRMMLREILQTIDLGGLEDLNEDSNSIRKVRFENKGI